MNNVTFKVKHEPPKIQLVLRHHWPGGSGNAVDCILFQFSLKEGNHEHRLLRLCALETLMPNQKNAHTEKDSSFCTSSQLQLITVLALVTSCVTQATHC